MTDETALEAALWKLHEREHAKLGEMLANKDEANNWQGGKVNGITAALELVRNASTLSTDVSGLVERLREPSTNEPTMHLWSSIRKMLQDGNKGSIPRDVFESILGAIDEERSAAADALASQSARLAAVEGERKFITIPKTVDEAEAMQKLGFAWLEANAPDRLTDLAKSLTAAQEENERLRDKVDGLEADLQNAVETAFKRGATEWARLNYPKLYAALSTTEGSDNG